MSVNVREALAQMISAYRHGAEVIWEEDALLADAILAAFNVTPKGARVTDDMVDALYSAIVTHPDFLKPGGSKIALRAALEAALGANHPDGRGA